MTTVPLDGPRRALAASQIRMARTLAWEASRRGRRHPHQLDDLRSAAMLALCFAARDYDPAKCLSFPSYASHRIRCGLRDVARAAIPLGFRRPLRTPTHRRTPFVGGFPPTQDETTLPAPDLPVGWELEAHDAVQHAIRWLHPTARALVVGTFLVAHRRPLATVAAQVGIHVTSACQLRKDAYGRLARKWRPELETGGRTQEEDRRGIPREATHETDDRR